MSQRTAMSLQCVLGAVFFAFGSKVQFLTPALLHKGESVLHKGESVGTQVAVGHIL